MRAGTAAVDTASSVEAWLHAHDAECFAARFEEEGFVSMRDASQTGVLDMVHTGDFGEEDMATIGACQFSQKVTKCGRTASQAAGKRMLSAVEPPT